MPIRRLSYLCDRLEAIGVSKRLAAQLSWEVSRWVSESGQEWTVNRLKLLKTGFLRRIAGEDYTLPYVATRKDALGAVPKGPFGVLWREASVSDMTSISRVLNAHMVYSTMKADRVTPKQWKKFHDSMCRTLPDQVKLRSVTDLLQVPHGMRVSERIGLSTIEEFVVRHGFSPAYVSKAIDDFVENDTGMALWSEFPQYKQSFNSLAKPVDSRISWDDMFGYHPELNSRATRDPVGRLGYSQEPGYKLRVFASPNMCHQLAMSRLKAQLFSLLRGVKWDCTYDQEIGTSWAQTQLSEGRRVWSIDLSDATNNFPLDVQLVILRKIGCDEVDIELFHRLSRAPWASNLGQNRTERWSVGQPLGLGPSFAAFALTHGLLVWSIAKNILRDPSKAGSCFKVLGDDIIIAEDRVATRYLEVMQDLGIPISMDKTIRSNEFAEFAGKLVTKQGVISVLKWRDPSDRSFIDVVRLLGPRSLSLLRRRQRRAATFLSVLPEPRGFGWNPRGIPLERRMQALHAFDELTLEEEQVFIPFERQWNKVRSRLEQPYFRLRFCHSPEGSWQENTSGKASVLSGREPTPVGSWRHLLSIAEMTGSPLKVPTKKLTPKDLRELKAMGFTTSTSATELRGVTTLEALELKITKLPEFQELCT